MLALHLVVLLAFASPAALRHHRAAPPPSRWAAVATVEARAAGVDPVLVRAIVEHESHGRAGVVSPLSLHCLGLMQICPHTLPSCRGGLGAPGCVAARARLLDGAHNLHVGVGRIVAWQAFCRRVTGRAEPRHWLSGYAGTDGHGVVCGQRRAAGRWRDAAVSRIVADVLKIAGRLRGGR